MGWSWGKRHPPGAAARFHLVCLASVIAATAFTLTTIDPVTVTIFAVVLGAAAVPLTYFPSSSWQRRPLDGRAGEPALGQRGGQLLPDRHGRGIAGQPAPAAAHQGRP